MSRMTCTVRTAIEFAGCFDAVADDAALAMVALRSHGMYRTFKTVEGAALVAPLDRKRLVVVIAANGADCHDEISSEKLMSTGSQGFPQSKGQADRTAQALWLA